jgi:2Fe-2S ferredoxin
MSSGAELIHIRVIADGELHSLTARAGEYRSLMTLIFDRIYVESFGECRGMGRCGTCRVSIDGDGLALTALNRNEASTLAKYGAVAPDVRLSCQILADQRVNGRTVIVLPAV